MQQSTIRDVGSTAFELFNKDKRKLLAIFTDTCKQGRRAFRKFSEDQVIDMILRTRYGHNLVDDYNVLCEENRYLDIRVLPIKQTELIEE